MQGDDNMFEWFFAWTARKSRKVLSKLGPVRAMFRLFGLNLYHPDPELDMWENLMWHFHNGLVGMKWGAISQVVLDLLNKLLYRIEMTSRYKYPIPEGNVVLDMISLSSNVATVLAAGPAALMMKNGQGYKKRPKALMDKMLELENVITQLKLKEGWKEAKKDKLPFLARHALELKKTESDPAPPKVSAEEQYNPN